MRSPATVVLSLALTVGLALAVAPSAAAQPMAVPPRLQMAIFKRVFQYDRTLAGKGPVQVLVVHSGGPSAELDEVLEAFRWAEIDAVAVPVGDLPGRIDAASVAYVMPGVAPEGFVEACARHGVVSISGAPQLAEAGHVSIAVGKGADGRPEIVVNRERLKAEAHDISAELLKLARLLQ